MLESYAKAKNSSEIVEIQKQWIKTA